MAAAHHIQHKLAIKCSQFQYLEALTGITKHPQIISMHQNSECSKFSYGRWASPGFEGIPARFPRLGDWTFFFPQVVLAFKGQFNQGRSPSFAEHQGILHSKYELANPLIPSHSCHKQVLHEHRAETIHILTILSEIFIRLSSLAFFLWHLKWADSCVCKVIKFTFGNGTWTQHTALRLRPEGIPSVQRWNMQRQE